MLGSMSRSVTKWVLPLVVLVKPHPKMVPCFAPLLAVDEGLSCGAWGEVQ